jgi:hypothetical protein
MTTSPRKGFLLFCFLNKWFVPVEVKTKSFAAPRTLAAIKLKTLPTQVAAQSGGVLVSHESFRVQSSSTHDS